MAHLIQVENISKEYINGDVITPVLHEVSFSIQEGEFVALMGPSGSGKSTLMHCLGFLDRFSSGSYLFRERDVTLISDTERALMRREEVGFVFQSFFLLPKSRVIDNVILPMVYARISQKKREQIARQALDSVGLSHRVQHLSNQLSGGERQRVAIARALVNNPKMIFADEPTGNLDTKSGEIVLKILQDLNEEKGTTIIMVTHELEAAQFAKRIIRVRDGGVLGDEKVIDRRKGAFHK